MRSIAFWLQCHLVSCGRWISTTWSRFTLSTARLPFLLFPTDPWFTCQLSYPNRRPVVSPPDDKCRQTTITQIFSTKAAGSCNKVSACWQYMKRPGRRRIGGLLICLPKTAVDVQCWNASSCGPLQFFFGLHSPFLLSH